MKCLVESQRGVFILVIKHTLNVVSDGMHSTYMVEESCPQALTTEQARPQQGHGDIHHMGNQLQLYHLHYHDLTAC